MPDKKPKLLPCPFCGGKAVYIFDDGADWNKGVACKKCEFNAYFFKKGWNVSSGRYGAGLEDQVAIANCWNHRAKSDIRGGMMIKRYEHDYVFKHKKNTLTIIEFDDGERLDGFRECQDGEWVKYDDIKHLLERSDSGDYTKCQDCRSDGDHDVKVEEK